MADKEIIKALECLMHDNCEDCPYYRDDCADRIKDPIELSKYALDLINGKQAENDDLLYKLTGVMHSVDKWLDGDELKQDEVNRAATMREKTLRLIETAKTEAIKEFAERLKDYLRKQPKWNCQKEKYNNVGFSYDDVFFGIDKIVKEYQERTKESENNEK